MTDFDPKKAKLATTLEHPGALFALCHDEPSQRLYAAGSDGAVYVVDLAAEKPALEKRWTPHDNYVSALVLAGDVLISAGFDRKLCWTDIRSGELLRSVEAHEGWVRDLALVPGPQRLASVGDDMRVKLWDVAGGEVLQTFAGHAPRTPQGYLSALYAVAVSPDGAHVAAGDRAGEVRVWEIATGEQAAALQAPTFYTYDPAKRVRSIGGIRSLCFAPDGAHLAISGIGQVTNVDGFVGPCRVEVWDWRAGKRTFAGQDGHKAVLNHVAYHPAEPWLVAAGGGDAGGVIAFWDQEKTEARHKAKLKGHVHRFALDAAGERLYAAGYGGVQLWHLA